MNVLCAADKSRFSPRLQTMLDNLVHPQWGLISRVHEERYRASGLYVVHASLASPGYFRDNAPVRSPQAQYGTGAGFNSEKAHWSAVGEAVERYCASIYRLSDFVFAAGGELPASMDLSRLIRAGSRPVQAYDPKISRYWVAGTRLSDGALVLVPAQMVYLGYEPRDPLEVLCQNDSSGLACGENFESACVHAFCEIIERDAFASNWLLGRQPPCIRLNRDELEQLDPGTHQAIDGRQNSQIRLFHLATVFGVHVVMSCLMTSRGHGLIAAAASPSLIRAVEKAVAEALQGAVAAARLMRKPRLASIDDIRTPSDHALYYLDEDRFSIVANFCSGRDSTTVGAIVGMGTEPVQLSEVVGSATRSGFEPVAVDVTTTDARRLGLSVVRVIVPGFQPLIFGPSCTQVVDRRRLDQWRLAWGLEHRTFNPHPHPFP